MPFWFNLGYNEMSAFYIGQKKLTSAALDYVDACFFKLAVSIQKADKMHNKLITSPYTKETSM